MVLTPEERGTYVAGNSVQERNEGRKNSAKLHDTISRFCPGKGFHFGNRECFDVSFGKAVRGNGSAKIHRFGSRQFAGFKLPKLAGIGTRKKDFLRVSNR